MKILIFLIILMLTSPLQAVVPLIRGDAPFNEEETATIRRVVGMTHPYRPYTPGELETPAIAGLLREAPDAVDTYIRQELRRLLPDRADIKVRVIPTAVWDLFILEQALGEERESLSEYGERGNYSQKRFPFTEFLRLSEKISRELPADSTFDAYATYCRSVLASRLTTPIPDQPFDKPEYREDLVSLKREIAKDLTDSDCSLYLEALRAELEVMKRNGVFMLRATRGVSFNGPKKGATTRWLLDFPLQTETYLTEKFASIARDIERQNPKLVSEDAEDKTEALSARSTSFGSSLFAGWFRDGLKMRVGNTTACVWFYVKNKFPLTRLYYLSLPRIELLEWGDSFSEVFEDWESIISGEAESFHAHFFSLGFTFNPNPRHKDARSMPRLRLFDSSLPLPRISEDPGKQKGAENIILYTEYMARILASRSNIIAIGSYLPTEEEIAEIATESMETQREAHIAFRQMVTEAAARHPR